jgi:N-acylneuraminate cytidylyltransferase/CMP-N,N'-diacetyllegionaminic acid synthase
MADKGHGKRTLGLIPARGGSRGIRKKNIAPLAGVPLITYTIRAALASRLLTDFIVSTDNREIADVAVTAGAKVPFMRPSDISGDAATAQEAALHALDAYAAGQDFDYVLLLQPTAPLRTAADIDGVIELARRHDATSVVSFTREETHHPYYMYFIEEGETKDAVPRMIQAFSYEVGTPRQDFPPAAYRNGAVYLTTVEHLRRRGSFVSADLVPYFMPQSRSVNIDTEQDLLYAEFLLSHPEIWKE